MKKWWLPLFSPILSILVVLLIGEVVIMSNRGDAGYGGIGILLGGLLFYCAVVIPLVCFLYARLCLREGRFRVAYALCQAFLITLPFSVWFLFVINDNEPRLGIWALVLFLWSAAWGLLGLIRGGNNQEVSASASHFIRIDLVRRPWMFPIVSLIGWPTAILAILTLGLGSNGDGTRFLFAIVSILYAALCYLVGMPAACFFYSAHCLQGQEHRLGFTLYQSFLTACSGVILIFKNGKSILFIFLLFAWCELWAMLGLRRAKREEKRKDAE